MSPGEDGATFGRVTSIEPDSKGPPSSGRPPEDLLAVVFAIVAVGSGALLLLLVSDYIGRAGLTARDSQNARC
jgi:hypothetical protein